MRTTLAAAVLTMAALAGCGGSPAVPGPGPGAGVPATGSATTGATTSAYVASLPAGSAAAATLNVESGVTTLAITAGAPSGQLVGAATPLGSGQTPVLSAAPGGAVDVRLASTAAGGSAPTLTLRLDRTVHWTISLDGGATSETVVLRAGRLAEVDLVAGVSRAVIELPARAGTQVVHEVGGASELTVSVPSSVAIRVDVGGGASAVTIGPTVHQGVAGGTTYAAPGYAQARRRLDLDLIGGVSAVTVRRA